jgi:hypothetical protein
LIAQQGLEHGLPQQIAAEQHPSANPCLLEAVGQVGAA